MDEIKKNETRNQMIPAQYGSRIEEKKMDFLAFCSFPLVCRAVSRLGTATLYVPTLKRLAFPGRKTPTDKELRRLIRTWERAGLVERWHEGSEEFIFISHWFRDHEFKLGCKPNTPRPPSLKKLITEDEWVAGNQEAIQRLRKHFRSSFRKTSETSSESTSETTSAKVSETVSALEGRSIEVRKLGSKKDENSCSPGGNAATNNKDNGAEGLNPVQEFSEMCVGLFRYSPTPEDVAKIKALMKDHTWPVIDKALISYSKEKGADIPGFFLTFTKKRG